MSCFEKEKYLKSKNFSAKANDKVTAFYGNALPLFLQKLM
jgi:hypothetical protein